jgi:hypothetical protein
MDQDSDSVTLREAQGKNGPASAYSGRHMA